MNEIKIFKHKDLGEIRTLLIEKEPWFVGKDICEILNYKEVSNMRKLLEEDEYKEINPQTVENTGFVQNGRTQKLEPNPNIKRMLLINESGLYNAIFNSTQAQARKFKRWVTSEVLPSIRKHGTYMTPETIEKVKLKEKH
ncbi:MAG: BRO family protein [Tissierellia bacterium]|nr:BRO family protein [Tissierellia bacterium]